MEDQVPFKVFVYWKEGGDKPEVRRFGIEKTVVTSFHYLNAKLQDVYPGLRSKSYSVTWKDEEGDDVVVSSDEEMMTALQALRAEVVKLNVYVKDNQAQDDDCEIVISAVADASAPMCAEAAAAGVHYGVTCDGCNKPVVGFRYKCTVCPDFDLCGRCESEGQHPEHCMVRVPTPTMPRTIIKAAIKRSRHFLKTVAGAMNEETLKECKRNRRDKSGDRRHRHHGHRQSEQGDHHRRPRSSWLETFATYMNEFANLAGDVDLPTSSTSKPENQPQGTQTNETPNQAKQTTESAQAPKQSEPAQPGNMECPFAPGVNVNQIKSLMEMYLGAENAAAMLKAFMPPAASTSASTSTSASEPPASSTQKETVDAEMPAEKAQEPAKMPEVVREETKSTNSSASSLRDASPDKGDDWTMINNVKDLMDESNAQKDPTPPIGFNLPQEFQERVNISGGLYPPLNTSTAEAEVASAPQPSAPEAPKVAQPTPTTQSKPQSAQPSQKTSPPQQPRPRHPKPHIEAAIQQMLNMGFTNDGGWLTQLLESTEGNVAAVLDLLTPVAPPRK